MDHIGHSQESQGPVVSTPKHKMQYPSTYFSMGNCNSTGSVFFLGWGLKAKASVFISSPQTPTPHFVGISKDAATSSTSTSTSFRFLPWALGDGSRGQFRRCSAAMTSSMLEPNIPLLRRFVQLEEVTTVVERSEMVTKKLDDLLEEIPGKGVEAWHFARFISFGVHFFFGMMFWYVS